MGFWDWLGWLKSKRQEKEDALKQTRGRGFFTWLGQKRQEKEDAFEQTRTIPKTDIAQQEDDAFKQAQNIPEPEPDTAQQKEDN